MDNFLKKNLCFLFLMMHHKIFIPFQVIAKALIITYLNYPISVWKYKFITEQFENKLE